MYPQMSKGVIAPALTTSRIRVSAILPIGLGRKAVTTPHKLSRNSSGVEAVMLAVR